ncbi:hypothetical protein [Fulvivirga sp.]|uniref:hypothetical protein n=1 Tax=Fulvivirga sp. TaxID=1931237 RepID=UPI0032EFF410
MNLESRKIEFVQEFLKLQSEEVISKLEQLLKKEKKTAADPNVQPMSREELNRRIEQSESDFQNGKFKSGKEILAKYNS